MVLFITIWLPLSLLEFFFNLTTTHLRVIIEYIYIDLLPEQFQVRNSIDYMYQYIYYIYGNALNRKNLNVSWD